MIAYRCREKIVSDGSGDQGEGIASRVFSFGFPTYSLAHSNHVSKLSLCLCLTQMGVETKKKDLGLGFSVLGFCILLQTPIVFSR